MEGAADADQGTRYHFQAELMPGLNDWCAPLPPIPRIGHEVIVDFLDGDCDQPIITGRSYPGSHPTPYELPRHKTLSAIRSKEHHANRSNELRLDDTHGEISAALTSDHATSAMHLGYLTHRRPRGGKPRGEGFELRSNASGALRAARGLLLSTEQQSLAEPVGGQLDRDQAIALLESALELARNLGQLAGDHQGSRPRGTGPQSAGPRGGGPTPSGRGIPRNSGGTPTPRQGQAGARQRQNQRRRRKRHETGVSGEHIADYFFVRRQRRRSKVNENGRLYEMRQPGHQGIDHIWHGDRLPMKYRVSDTKATGKFQHPWLETPWRVFQALRYGLDVYMGTEDEGRLAGGLGKPTKTGRQLSHRWIAERINKAKVVDAHKGFIEKVEDWEGVNFKMTPSVSVAEDGTPERRLVKCPYDRSLITVVGPNHNLHDNRKGRVSPRCTKGQTSHQISAEFVIPTDILEG